MKKYFYSKLFALLLVTTAAVSSCGKDNTDTDNPTPPAQTIDEQLNHWMFDYMKERYLWNEAVKTLKPDFSVNYNHFLQNVLNGVAAQGDVNHDDGHWVDGYREDFYSVIARYKLTKARAVTRGTRETAEGTGIVFMNAYYIEIGKEARLLELLAVSPGSAADKAGLKRGTLITRVNGTQITEGNLTDMIKEITPEEAGKTVRITTAVYEADLLVDQPEITLVSASFDDNPVWVSKTLTANNGDKVGYLCYASFNAHYDQQLMDEFKKFKSDGVKELILDLRYNGGGHLLSSAVLGTLIAGEAKKDQVFSALIYNKTRTEAGETDDNYLIGNKSYCGAEYQPIADAAGGDYALGLQQIYVLCTSSTASASELIVNGLRGLDIDVHLIGMTTNGKNVGMEPKTKTLGDYDYVFSPITFYSANAKGFKNYSNGFPPDVVVNEDEYVLHEWGAANDPLLYMAMKWINDGVKPSVVSVVPDALPTVRSAGFEKRKVLDRIKWGGSLEGMILLPPADAEQ